MTFNVSYVKNLKMLTTQVLWAGGTVDFFLPNEKKGACVTLLKMTSFVRDTVFFNTGRGFPNAECSNTQAAA
jgi:hypothetical protein